MKRFTTALFILAATAAWGATTQQPATLKDVQPTNTPTMKKAHQQFDFTLSTGTSDYTCRTPSNKKINPTDFVVGSSVTFQVSGKHGEVKTQAGKKASCDMVRVGQAGT